MKALETLPPCLIVSASARYIAEAAASGGRQVVAVDGFADADLRALPLMREVLRVPLTARGLLDGSAVLSACCDLHKRHGFTGVVMGAGAEGVVAELDHMFGCIGNRPQIFSECADRRRLHRVFAALEIPHAAAARQQGDRALPEVPELLKRSGASGGSHVRIRSDNNTAVDDTEVAEAYLPGTTVSHLFIADGAGVATVGMNTLWQSRHDPTRPFCSGGAINRSMLDTAQRNQAEVYAQRLVRHWRLRGLNCIDYIFSAGQLTALELNPRPSAAMQLYLSSQLFNAHEAACQGQLRRHLAPVSRPCAYALVYARRCMRVAKSMFLHSPGRMTEFCDVPLPGTVINAGEPICSLRTLAPSFSISVARVISTLQDVLRRMTLTMQAIQP